MKPVIEVEHGWLQYSGRPILRDLDLTVAAGDRVALLGENGSGKSTLVRAILGLTPLTSGQVRLFGEPRERFGDWSRIGYVPQRSTAAVGVPATVAEVVASGRLARRRPFWPAGRDDRRAVRTALETVGLGDRAGDALHTLSGGQQQRALIARALAHRAPGPGRGALMEIFTLD
ncbi:MAG: ATP-binding cassette domain-containing protein, partial [Myxococcales bacterium]